MHFYEKKIKIPYALVWFLPVVTLCKIIIYFNQNTDIDIIHFYLYSCVY